MRRPSVEAPPQRPPPRRHRRRHERSTPRDVGGGSTEIVLAKGPAPIALWSLPLGALRLTETSRRATEADVVATMRRQVEATLATTLRFARGSSGTLRALIAFATHGSRRATLPQLDQAVATLFHLAPPAAPTSSTPAAPTSSSPAPSSPPPSPAPSPSARSWPPARTLTRAAG